MVNIGDGSVIRVMEFWYKYLNRTLRPAVACYSAVGVTVSLPTRPRAKATAPDTRRSEVTF